MILIRPFNGPVTVTQAFKNVFYLEPQGYLYTDGSIGYIAQQGALLNHYHNGVDYDLPCGTPLHAAADGTAVVAGVDTTGFGNCVRIDHGVYTTLYAHLSEIGVTAGRVLKQGDAIGLSGTSGNSTGCHLHWSVIRDKDRHYVDPAPFLALPGSPKPPTGATPDDDGIRWEPFTVTAMPGVVSSFDGPSIKCVRIGTLESGLVVRCDGWMRGGSRPDAVTGRPDSRWYHIAPGTGMMGWLSSSRVIGNAPGSTPLEVA